MIALWQTIAAYVQQHVLGALLALGAGSLALAKTLLPHYLTKRVDARFDSQLESHKSELQRVLEYDKFELQRKLTAGSLFMQKQHAAAGESYSAICWAHGEVGGLFGIQQSVVLDGCNRKDLINILNHYKIYEGKKAELIADWELDPKSGREAIQRYIFDTRTVRAQAKMVDAQNLMYLNAIYFSDATAQAFQAFVGVCNSWIMKSLYPPQRGDPYEPYSRPELNAALERVRLALRAELINPTSDIEQRRLPDTMAGAAGGESAHP